MAENQITQRCLLCRPCRILLMWFMLQNINRHREELQERQRRKRNRRMWVHPLVAERQEKGHFYVLYQDLRRYPDKFILFCRLSILAFDRLLHILAPHLTFADTIMRKAITAEERLLITLRFLATGESYTSLHLQFRVGKSTISQIVRCTCNVIWQKLQPMVMPSPTEETWLQVAAGFQSVANFPNCIGAVDGKHVRVQQPPRSGSRFFNYKKYFSVVLMAVADAHCKFVAIDTPERQWLHMLLRNPMVHQLQKQMFLQLMKMGLHQKGCYYMVPRCHLPHKTLLHLLIH
ncbi:uncharacterized protein [Dendrobates tinctorius]|uniref:uncharacterized protein n=1 Tax=Dendrobates tinctorius TaxID=92724 RepID=UPI003CC9592E